MSNVPAGWYPAPTDATKVRWWDGTQWTEQHAERYTVAAPLKAPEGTKVYNVWIWLVTLLPILSYLSLFSLFSYDWSGMFSDPSDSTSVLRAEMGLMTSPAYVALTLGGWAMYGLLVWFSYLDYKTLRNQGLPRPFHWAWTFLSSYVYVIGRSVVARRRTGDGIAPMWITIAVIVFGFVLSIVFTIVLFSIVMNNIHTYAPSLGS